MTQWANVKRLIVSDRTIHLIAIAVQVVAVLLGSIVPEWRAGDIKRYDQAASQVLKGLCPYRDFSFEYPPLALVPIVLPKLVVSPFSSRHEPYALLFTIEYALFSVVMSSMIARLIPRLWPGRSVRGPVVMLSLMVIATLPYGAWRFDFFPALATLLAFWAVVRDRPGLAGVLIGVGIAAKIYPGVLVPVVCAGYLARRDWRSTGRLVGSALATVVVIVLPFWAFAQQTFWSFLTYHASRGLQLESVMSGLVLIACKLGWTTGTPTHRFGAEEIVSPLADAIVPVIPVALAAGTVLVALSAFRQSRGTSSSDSGRMLLKHVTAAIAVFMLTNKVLSPQFVIWLMPFVPLLSLDYALTSLLAFAITTAIFPFGYEGLNKLETIWIGALNLRNLLLAGIAAGLLLIHDPQRKSDSPAL